MPRIVIDPVTRIEGHLRIEAQVDGHQVTDAWSSGTMFRGIELILRGRDPREACIWAQRICGVCTTVHALASVRAVEDAIGVEIPDNARLVRNIIAGTQNVQDHIIHFYHLHALDWVDVLSALKADPAKTSQLAQSLSDWPKSSTVYFKAVQDRIQALVGSHQLSLFSSGDWGHPAYQLPPEANLMAVAHYIEALELQREFIRIQSVLGGKNPHPQTYLVGGMATAMVATTTSLIVRDDIHPALANLLTQVLVTVHREPAVDINGEVGVFDSNGAFPIQSDPEFKMADEALRVYRSGAPFLQQFMPFWLATLIDRMVLMAIPVIGILLPALRFAPLLYTWRVRRRLLYWYKELKSLENDATVRAGAEQIRQKQARIEEIEAAVDHMKLPLGFANQLYDLRQHIDMVRRRFATR